ncbi:hypothetical protein [Gloeobacter kilaueensis]|uniref:Periplasmic component of the Tol biopolymer transport system n=1 Tax=Gloeobacter kilaueensis (strain ATCC BAA-2537 / CCAP 1431/1 / ULC 316 / JS1) TaxID=1183438 RepID=U5QIU5_GLOK1|nr:hypothetical protein [Gloeobacter kilaueensis]AGY57610.1 Periplasmic component of the Tol biopolymer transport system [Gloeobacter kilaueensis JS1]
MHFPNWQLALPLCLCAALTVLPAQAQSTSDVLVTLPGIKITDLQFDQPNSRFVWSDQNANVWIGFVDPTSGAFNPTTGMGTLVTTGALFAPDQVAIGPRWVYSAQFGPQIVFTALPSSSGATAALGSAYNSNGQWFTNPLPSGNNRSAPVGSLDQFDGFPRIFYQQSTRSGQTTSKWRNLNDAGTETAIPGTLVQNISWIAGQRALVYTALANNVPQVFSYNIDTKVQQQLTFDSPPKSSPMLWQAPEYGDNYLLFAVSNQTSINVYQNINNAWALLTTLVPPAKGPYLLSPGVFAYNGKSYIYMGTIGDPTPGSSKPSDIWIAGIDPTAPFYRQCSDGTTKNRARPQVFFTSNGPYLYFFAKPAINVVQGVYYCNPGL